MLETFGWTDGQIFANDDYQVVALESPCDNALARCRLGAVYGVVVDGYCGNLRRRYNSYSIPAQSYFATRNMESELCSVGGKLLLITAAYKDVPFMVGGEVEPTGRLRYIDGCTDTLLIPPWRKGEACLNFLHIPPRIEQTMHTHPSDRFGVVLSGEGQCVTPDGTTDLVKGMIWRIPTDAPHRFRTDDKDLRIVAWHPDSDFGATDEDHPMLNRSLVDGVSAKDIPDIRTR